MIGTILDNRYRILRLLGSGGMGQVYLGEHLLLGRSEAIKILKSRFAQDEGHLARFRREARATNRLQHNNIVSFYDFGKMPDGRLYLTMEFVDGPNLKECLHKVERLSISRTAAILKQLALAIDYAHSKGVIHRDLKPENLVLVEEPGGREVVKVLDFGVAKITDPTDLESMAITKKGQVFGTPAYISPEQIRGEVDDPRSDIYALGCIAYELLTGRPPFEGRSLDILEAHMSSTPALPSSKCDGAIPTDLNQVILQCLAKVPEARYQSGAALAEALDSMVFESGIRRNSVAMAETNVGGFGSEATLKGELADFVEEESHTTDVLYSRFDQELRLVLRSLAENLCDLGCPDPMLLVLLAEANQVEQELDVLRRELLELVHSDQVLEQEYRKREASLRFALGELHFEEGSEEDSGPLRHAIAMLTSRLEKLGVSTRVRHGEIMERQIDKTASRAGKLEELRAIEAQLSDKVDFQLSRMTIDPSTVELREERARLLLMLEIEGE